MTTIRREIYLNPLEPSLFSFRAPSDVDITLETSLKQQDGTPYTADLEMSVQLTGRSNGNTLVYAMPTSDLANGKARAVIPALNDVNGYNVMVVGTLEGGLELLAQGIVFLSGKAQPISETIDAIDNIPLNITRGAALTLDLKLWQDEGKINQFTGATVIANLRASIEGPVVAQITVTQQPQPNEVRLSLTDVQTTALDSSISTWDVVVVQGGRAQTVIRGDVRFYT